MTQFEVEASYLRQVEVQQVGGQTIVEYWIPAVRLEEFDDHIVGEIVEVARYARS